jgi:hypothetical protein
MLREELRDVDVMAVLFALEIVLNENQRLIRARSDAIKTPVRAAFLDRRDLDLSPPRSAENGDASAAGADLFFWRS